MTSRPMRLLLILPLLAALTAAPAFALDLGGHVRDGVAVGILLGGGWTSYDFQIKGEEAVETDYQSAFAGGINVGWAPSDYVIGSIGFYGWRKSFNQNITPIEARNYYFMGEVSWFPRGEGFWVKGGIGWANSDLTVIMPERPYALNGSGFTYGAGVGYEFRISNEAAIGAAYDARWLDIGDGDLFDSYSSFNYNWSFSIRFYPGS